MRIAQVAPLHESVPPKLYGGTERVVSWLTEQLVGQKHRVTLFATGDSVTTAELRPGREGGLRTDPLCNDAIAPHIAMIEQVAKAAAEFDIIHFHTDYLHFPLSRHLNFRAITTLHGRLDTADLMPVYKEFSELPVVSISRDQRKPVPGMNWVGNVYHGLPKDLFSFHPQPGKYLAFTSDGVVVDATGRLDPERSFRYVNNFELLASQRVSNNPQPALSSKPIDFISAVLPDVESDHAYWLYGDETHQLMILTDAQGNIAVRPIAHLRQDHRGRLKWSAQSWAAGFPLHLFEDSQLRVPPGSDRDTWLSAWHTEREWVEAVHRCEYSNAVIGITEELSPVADNVPGPTGASSILVRFARRRRELVQADFHVFAADHWNFNVRFPNPGGNHGSFFRISTHSVWMLAGAGIPKKVVSEPYDSLNFGSTILSLTGHKPPMPDRVVILN